MRQQLTQSWGKFTQWFLTGELEQKALSDQEEEIEDFRRLMKDQLQQLQRRGLPIQIVTL